MDSDTTPINARPKRRPPEAVEDVSLALREHVVWPVEDGWLALSDRGRAIVAGGAVALALGVGIGALSLSGSGGSEEVSARVAVAAAPAAGEPAPPQAQSEKKPTLHGAAPVFKAPARRNAKVAASEPATSDATAAAAAAASAGNTGNAATDKISSTPGVGPTAARASSAPATADGPPAGPEAVAVAHKFASAFVVYETGGEKDLVRKAFTATTTPELRKALLRRPPRQPAGIEVPKARVLNVVAAPSHGDSYPVSVSLLRVGVTSELRLELEQLKNKQWRVSNVLG
jgi:hypothetical protein